MVTLKNIWAQRLNYTKNLKKTLLDFLLLDLRILAYLVLLIYWSTIIIGVEALGPWSSNTFPISMYRGSRIRELVTSGLKLDACYLGLEACRLALAELGA
jgi:hypothetical protein